MKNTLTILALLTLGLPGYSRSTSDSTKVFFHQGKSGIVYDFKGNRERLDSLVEHMKYIESSDSLLKLRKIRVSGAASPEGSVEINYRLSDLRGNHILDYVSERVTLPDSAISFKYVGRDWAGLLNMVKNDSKVPYKADVERLLNEIVLETRSGEKESFHSLQRIKNLRGGIPYRYMYSQMFPALRYSTIYVDYDYSRIPTLTGFSPTLPVYEYSIDIPDMMTVVGYGTVAGPCKPFYMGLKTNLLYDALALPNIGAEFYVGKNWSVVANWTYGWWDTDRRHRYWRAYGGDLAVRRWFGRQANEKPLTGHHLGVYGGVVTYDFEFGGTGYMGGRPHGSLWDKCNYFAGVEYGYSLPIARRLNLDFTLGIGYMGGEYLKYVPQDGKYLWQSTHKLHWFGPTKAEISLVWLIGCGNYNSRKGGIK